MRTLLTTLLTLSLSISIVNTAYADYQDGLDAAKLKDYDTALNIWMPLATQGDIDAQSALAQMYFFGNGFKQNYKQAVKWLTKAAEQGDANSQYNLGIMYRDGLGVSENRTKYFYWLQKAVEQGSSQAKNLLEQEQFIKQKAIKTAKEGDAKLQFILGSAYLFGDMLINLYDPDKGMYWLKKSAAQDNIHAQDLVVLLEGGGFVSELIKKAEQGDPYAQLGLASLYVDGDYGTSKDLVKYKFWFDKFRKNTNANTALLNILSKEN